jgi:hypothetical protein
VPQALCAIIPSTFHLNSTELGFGQQDKHITMLLHAFKFIFILSALLAFSLSVELLFKHDNVKTGGIFTLVVSNPPRYTQP